MSWVLGWLRAISRKMGSLPEHMTLMGTFALAPAARIWLTPGLSASISMRASMMRAPTTPGVEVQSSISCSMVSESGSNGLTSPKLPGCLS